jgi:hypothetical protein
VLDAVFEHLPVGLALAAGPDARLIRVSRHGLGPAARDSLAMLTGGETGRPGDEAPRPPEELPPNGAATPPGRGARRSG